MTLRRFIATAFLVVGVAFFSLPASAADWNTPAGTFQMLDPAALSQDAMTNYQDILPHLLRSAKMAKAEQASALVAAMTPDQRNTDLVHRWMMQRDLLAGQMDAYNAMLDNQESLFFIMMACVNTNTDHHDVLAHDTAFQNLLASFNDKLDHNERIIIGLDYNTAQILLGFIDLSEQIIAAAPAH